MKRKSLGRGLDALLGGVNKSPSDAIKAAMNVAAVPVPDAGPMDGKYAELPVEFLQRGKYQPRRDIQNESLQELADSIKAQGVMQPIVVRLIGPERYEIIAGERRWRASQLAGLDRVPAIIRDVPDETAIAMALIENIQREDLNPVEEAVALKRLQDEFELTHQQVADAVGKSRAAVSNSLRLLNLSNEVRTLLEHGDLEMGHARCLLSLEPGQQSALARQIIARALSVRQAEALVRKTQQEEAMDKVDPPKNLSPDLKKLEEGLMGRLGVKVQVQHSARGAGKLVLKYKSLDELDGLLARLEYKEQ
ncbi:MAG TPA: ParB/RepB/Spo0J family partition protein [Cellvibrionaceae bacterium]|nr:ParB/RepB/Spo0J family partition protein [Cellvibrionaceae bacterium]HNG59436.1 ParB/RepB/Spo0J family partition protein [Cellvibrionaceae bacterium]